MDTLESSRSIREIAQGVCKLHELRSVAKGLWSVRVTGNWRLTFRYDNRQVSDLDYLDYH